MTDLCREPFVCRRKNNNEIIQIIQTTHMYINKLHGNPVKQNRDFQIKMQSKRVKKIMMTLKLGVDL